MSARHLASFALIGMTGHRVGTRFVFKPEEIDAVHGNPYFKWRNDDARREYREWKQSQDGGHDMDVTESARVNALAALLLLQDKYDELDRTSERELAACERERDEALRRLEWFEGELAKADEWKAQCRVLEAKVERWQVALNSIASNTCCDGCQEAARVASAALPTPSQRKG